MLASAVLPGQADALLPAGAESALPTSSFPEGFPMGEQAGLLGLEGVPPMEAKGGMLNESGMAGGKGGGASARARGQNTHVFANESDLIVRLHQTNIVKIPASGDVTLSSGGWRTHQTLKGINMSLKNFVPGLQVVADGHVAEGSWRVTNGRDWSVPFYDGVTVPGAGPQNLAAQAEQMPGLFERMSINTAGGYDEGMGGGMGGGGGGGKGSRSTRGRNNRGGGERANGNPRSKGPPDGNPLAVGRTPLPSQPPPKLEELPTDMEAYDNIPVEASGEDCPAPIEGFSDVALHPLLQARLEAQSCRSACRHVGGLVTSCTWYVTVCHGMSRYVTVCHGM